ncbi:MAG: GAF domain-containing protein [Candidatus Limnocylindria bacterium]
MTHATTDHPTAPSGDALNQLREEIALAPGPQGAAQRVVERLHDRFENYNWVGIYWIDGDELVLGPWTGPEATEHTRIPIGSGICGAAATSGRTEIVDDVNADPRYLACFASTQSEIVVPMFADGHVVGEIDIDADRPAAFTKDDALFLEEVAALVAPLRPRT